jgi:prepilin-type N-terminal cleavage/methylation domain-containing protein
MKRTRNAFTLVEMLIVITIISILAAMAISSYSNAAQDSRTVLVRQQLAVIQEALNSYVNRQIGRVSTSGGNPATVEQVRAAYNMPPPRVTLASVKVSDRLTLITSYLDASNFGTNLLADDTKGRLTTEAMRQTNTYVTLPDWALGNYPKAQLLP